MNKILKNEKLKINSSKILLVLCGILLASIILRINYFTLDLPVTADALGYFYYASDIVVSERIPDNYIPANPGWPMFVASFLSLFNFESVNDYMQLQKILSIIISTITTIPVYFLCRKFFDQKFSLLGTIFFGFEPHLIQNSLLGITDPLFILLVTLSIVFCLSSNKKLVFLSFGVVALSSYVRAEGLIVFLVLISILTIKEKNEKKKIFTICLCILIFSVTVLPVVFLKYEILEDDRLFMRVGSSVVSLSESTNSGTNSRIMTSIENFPKYFGWSLIPTFIVFLPLGIISLVKNWSKTYILILTISILMILPMIYAYSIPLKDVRYVFYLFPILTIISLFGIRFISKNQSYQKILLVSIIFFIGITSVWYLESKIDLENEKDVLVVSKIISNSATGVNSLYPESQYFEVGAIPIQWDEFKKEFSIEREYKKPIRDVQNKIKIFKTNDFESLEDFIIKSGTQLTHIVIDDNIDRPEFLKKVYENGDEIEFLELVYDSKEKGLDYNVKIFKINYELFN